VHNVHSGDEKEPGPLEIWLREKIRHDGPITVAEFMGHALYHPRYGYYTTGPNIGPRGDFVTSPEASPAFGKLFVTHLADIDRLLGNPHTFHAIEFGPGRGTLASDLLDEMRSSHPDLYARLRYSLVDVSPALREAQKARLIPSHRGKVEWYADVSEVPGGVEGAVIANELVDAFPVHVIENKDGVLGEQYVALDRQEKLAITLRPLSDERLSAFLVEEGIEVEPGERVEVNLAVQDWLNGLGAAMTRGVATLIDYGDEAPARYSPARREGTLLGYYGGSVTDSILAHPGEQDLTALVDFTALKHAAVRAGFNVVGITRQANFLLGLGLGTTLRPESLVEAGNVDTALKYRRGLQSLISMEGLGRFHVLMLSKGVDLDVGRQSLSGWKYAAT
jgi:SAM-dependent MidA family methyltransferase